MSKKFTVGKIRITSPLYRRFTNMNRGNTPRSFFTKYIRLRVVYNTPQYGGHTPQWDKLDSVQASRIYQRPLREYGGVTSCDERFDFFSFTCSKYIFKLADGLKCSRVAGVEIEVSWSSFAITYVFPFVSAKPKSGSVKMEHEGGSLFYPGVYYSRGKWFWTNKLSETLNHNPTFSLSFSGSTLTTSISSDYTPSTDFEMVSVSDLSASGRLYMVYIPFDQIRTPILQAYLPLSVNKISYSDFGTHSYEETFYDHIPDVNDPTRTVNHLYQPTLWMGRMFDPLTVNEESIQTFTGQYNNRNSPTSYNKSLIESYFDRYLNWYFENVLQLSSSSFQVDSSATVWCVQRRPRSFATYDLVSSQPSLNPPSFPTTYLDSTDWSEPSHVVSDLNINVNLNWFMYTSVAIEQAILVRTFKVGVELRPSVYRTLKVFFMMDMLFDPQYEEREEYSIGKNHKLNEIIAKVVSFNAVPIHTDFQHLTLSE